MYNPLVAIGEIAFANKKNAQCERTITILWTQRECKTLFLSYHLYLYKCTCPLPYMTRNMSDMMLRCTYIKFCLCSVGEYRISKRGTINKISNLIKSQCKKIRFGIDSHLLLKLPDSLRSLISRLLFLQQ